MYLPDNVTGKIPVVIFSHGFGENYRDLTPHAKDFLRAGAGCFFFDFCGGGPLSRSDGSMREMTVKTECEDLNTVIDEVRNMEFVDKSRMFLFGTSMGGLVTALVSAGRPKDIPAIVLWYPAFNVPDDVMKREKTNKNTIFGLPLSWDYDEVALQIAPYRILKSYQNPALLIHGEQDKVVPPVYSKRAAQVMSNAKLHVIPGAAHGFLGEDAGLARQLSVEFLLSNLSG